MKGINIGMTNRILVGLLFVVAGLLKIFVITPTGVTQMLTGIGIPLASFFAWIVILSEIVFGLAVLANWKTRYAVWPLIIIMLVASFTVHFPNEAGKWTNFLMHLVLASNLWLIGNCRCEECDMPMTEKKRR